MCVKTLQHDSPSTTRINQSNHISQLFKQTNGYVFINLQISVSINNLLIYLLGFCCFFAMIKFTYICQLNSRLALVMQTLQHSAKELFSFLTIF